MVKADSRSQKKALNAQEMVILERLGITPDEYAKTSETDQGKALNAQEMAILERLGITPDEYAKACT